MNSVIVSFLCFGVLFGLTTYSKRHLFSEGPTRQRKAGENSPLDGRLMWVLTCSALWPILALTGVYSVWRISRARVRTRREDAR